MGSESESLDLIDVAQLACLATADISPSFSVEGRISGGRPMQLTVRVLVLGPHPYEIFASRPTRSSCPLRDCMLQERIRGTLASRRWPGGSTMSVEMGLGMRGLRVEDGVLSCRI